MITLSWNCRGLGNLETVQELMDLMSKKQTNLIFLIEVKVCWVKVEKVQNQLRYAGLCFIPGHNNGGGLAFFMES